jgi:predicted ferric reductase
MTTIRSNSGWFLLCLLSLLPLAFWYRIEPMSARLATRATTLQSLGQATGLAGIVLFASTVVLSSRLAFFEDYFGGMNRVYVAHHVCGSLTLVLLLFHPVALAAQYMTFSSHDAARLLLPSANWAINWGIFALLAMIGFVVLTLYVRIPYHVWEFSHRFLGPAFFLATLHAFTIHSEISRDAALRDYVLVLSIVAMSAYLYRTALGRWLVSRFEYRVESVRELNDRSVHIKMKPVGRPLPFLAGQFVFVDFHQPGISAETHPYSIASRPRDSGLEVVVRSLGDYTSRLKRLKPGALARVEGPFGRFTYHRYRNRDQIWIAGGIGITPFMSMVKTLENSGYNVDMYYGANNLNEAVFLEELVELSPSGANFRFFPFLADVHGFLSAAKVNEMSGGLGRKDIFLCGPPVMVRNLVRQFLQLGVPSTRIHSDEFALR